MVDGVRAAEHTVATNAAHSVGIGYQNHNLSSVLSEQQAVKKQAVNRHAEHEAWRVTADK